MYVRLADWFPGHIDCARTCGLDNGVRWGLTRH